MPAELLMFNLQELSEAWTLPSSVHCQRQCWRGIEREVVVPERCASRAEYDKHQVCRIYRSSSVSHLQASTHNLEPESWPNLALKKPE